MRPANSAFWPQADDDILMTKWAGRAVVGEEGWKAIAETLSMPRSWQACRQRVSYLHRKAIGRIPQKRPPKERKVNGRIYRRDTMQEPVATLPQPVSITAALFGDPLPGRSALDKRPRADAGTVRLLCDLPRRSPMDQMRTGLT